MEAASEVEELRAELAAECIAPENERALRSDLERTLSRAHTKRDEAQVALTAERCARSCARKLRRQTMLRLRRRETRHEAMPSRTPRHCSTTAPQLPRS